MLRLDILSVVPQLMESPFSHSIVKRAKDKGLVEINLHNLRDYATNKYKSVDDYQYGGGAGMVMMIEPIAACMDKLLSERTYDEVIFLTPDGITLNQGIANELSLKGNLMILCGHYKGVDERVRQRYITREISVGDYVLSGGELAATVLGDAIIRLIPGVLNDETSALSDSFQDGLLSPPVYTRPAEFKGMEVPEILRSGNEALIEDWRQNEAEKRTKERRPDLIPENPNNLSG